MTGVTGHFRASQIPFQDRAGQEIQDYRTWMMSRNQQRNWETLLQIVSLRCLPEDIVYPQLQTDFWQFSFVVDSPAVLGGTEFDLLYRDCDGVPMIQDIATGQASVLFIQGKDKNIWFSSINI
jgi:hypothetical protein